jgi:hypothetical protein
MKVANEALIFQELHHTVSLLGVKNTITELQKLRYKKYFNTDDEIMNCIIDAVCENINIEKEEVLNGKKRFDEKKIAIGLIAYILKNNIKIDHKIICEKLNRESRDVYIQIGFIVALFDEKNRVKDLEKKARDCYDYVIGLINK